MRGISDEFSSRSLNGTVFAHAVAVIVRAVS